MGFLGLWDEVIGTVSLASGSGAHSFLLPKISYCQ
jgi:hypothetical protein